MKRKAGTLAVLGIFGLLLGAQAEARIVTIEIRSQEPLLGTAFGEVGPYVRIVGVARGELDPRDARNHGIVNLDRAPRNASGMVEYETDVYILRPADPARGNGRILYEVNNRGRKLLPLFLMDATGPSQSDPRSEADLGNALFLRLGYTLVWSGWDADAPRANGGLAMQVPLAMEGGRPIVRMVREELVSGTRAAQVERFRLSYESAGIDPAQARLTMRRREADAPQAIAAAGWEFVDPRTIRLLPADTRPEPGTLYELRYRAQNPSVLGIGFAATRDLISFLRYETRDTRGTANPVGLGPGRPITHALAVGISQSGRYLRDHISGGFNQDERRRRVFDGVLAHISGVGRVFLNAEFGEAWRTNTQHEDHTYPENAFPFSTATMTDPITRRSGSLFRNDGFDPLLIEVNTATEYWQKGASLLHTDPLGTRDVALPANARVFQIAGTQHGGRFGSDASPGPCVNPRNPHSAGPALRALLVALDEWVTRGVAPPPSRVPTIRARTLVAPDRTGFPALQGVAIVRQVNAVTPPGDWTGPQPAARGYVPLVPRVDADGNEVAGIRLPDIAVPLGTYTGWNEYKPPFPAGEICDRDGSFIAFARTRAERAQRNDPRPSLEERYRGNADYARQVEAAAAQLVRDRLLLVEDAERFAIRARARNIFGD